MEATDSYHQRDHRSVSYCSRKVGVNLCNRLDFLTSGWQTHHQTSYVTKPLLCWAARGGGKDCYWLIINKQHTHNENILSKPIDKLNKCDGAWLFKKRFAYWKDASHIHVFQAPFIFWMVFVIVGVIFPPLSAQHFFRLFWC